MEVLHTILILFRHLPGLPKTGLLFILVIFELFAEILLVLLALLDNFADLLLLVLTMSLLAITQLLSLALCPMDKVLLDCFNTAFLLLLPQQLIPYPLLLFCIHNELLSTRRSKWSLIGPSWLSKPTRDLEFNFSIIYLCSTDEISKCSSNNWEKINGLSRIVSDGLWFYLKNHIILPLSACTHLPAEVPLKPRD